jgi:two-component system nitrogen regulation response regulator NtrX
VNERILVVDDEQDIRRSLEIVLGGEGFRVVCAGDGEEALASVEAEPPAAVFLDIELPRLNGMEVLRRLRTQRPDLPVVMFTGHGTIERAVEATRLGAFEFVEKPFSRDRILLLARNAIETGRLRELARLRAAEVDDLVGESAPMDALRETITRVAPTNARVLILGESGTGKELVARVLHRLSSRVEKPFVRVNCAAIANDLIEAELFGAVKGAYTGSVAAREGRFAAADGGTLFLDEVGDMSLAAQAKVLRVLQEGEYEPVGSTRTTKVDVRVLAATNQDLPGRVAAGLFRADLLFRLNVIPIVVPPLRERIGDVRLLGELFLARCAARDELPAPRLQAESWRILEAYAWPGNIRELKNIIERLVILRRGAEVGPEALPMEMTRQTPDSATSSPAATASPHRGLPLPEVLEAVERDLIQAALDRHKGSVARAAAELGVERTRLHKRISALGLSGE